jgi:hypothetical protein
MPSPAGKSRKWSESLQASYIDPKSKVAVANLQWCSPGACITSGVEGLDNLFSVDQFSRICKRQESWKGQEDPDRVDSHNSGVRYQRTVIAMIAVVAMITLLVLDVIGLSIISAE